MTEEEESLVIEGLNKLRKIYQGHADFCDAQKDKDAYQGTVSDCTALIQKVCDGKIK